ncbi:MAG: hypothetical protein ACI4MI_05750 [Christensenellales bacterium]
MKEKPVKKSEKVLNDVFMVLMTILSCVGFICILFVGGFLGVIGAMYLVKSFSFEGIKILGGIVLSILAILTCALMIYADYLIAKATVKGVENYLEERKNK